MAAISVVSGNGRNAWSFVGVLTATLVAPTTLAPCLAARTMGRGADVCSSIDKAANLDA